MIAAMKNHAALLREEGAALHIPYTSHVSEHVVKTHNSYVMAFRMDGIGFENADDEDLNIWHETLNEIYRNVAKPNISIWHTIVRRKESHYPDGEFADGFARDLNEKYRRRVTAETLMVNELYLAVIYRPQPNRVGTAAMQLLKGVNKEALGLEQEEALDELSKLQQHLWAALNKRYDLETLGIYQQAGRYYSSLLEYFGVLINGEWQRIALPRSPLNEVLATSRLSFGVEAMEYRTATETRLAAVLGIKEYPTPSVVGMFNPLLKAPFSFVLTQSFTFIHKSHAQALLTNQFNRMVNIGDLAETQTHDLKDAIDQVSGNELVMGDHHLTLLVQGEPQAVTGHGPGQNPIRELNTAIAWAKAALGDTGMTVAREDLALEAAFWAQLPGNFDYRVRLSPITSRNFAAMAPYHNYPVGRATGNHWGEAMAVFITNAKSHYHFSLHASDPKDPTGGSQKDVAHTYVCGPTGSGKTVTLGFLVTMLRKHAVTQVIFDNDYGLEILIRALGGLYLPIRNKQPTGFNPLQLEPTPNNIEFLHQFLRRLAYRPDKPLKEQEIKTLHQALEGTLGLDRPYRRLSRLIEFLDVRDPEGLYARLSPWAESRGGEYAWVFDNAEDSIAGLMESAATIGFDSTEFLKNPITCAPITMYLFHLVQTLMDGRRLICWLEEFSRSISDPAFQEFAKDGLERARKKNAGFVFVTQSPSSVIQSPIARTLIEQTATQIFLPNDRARQEDYIDGFGLSEREFLKIKREITPGSRQFLIKQGQNSVVCELDLKGFDFELDVISGRTQNVQAVRELIAQVGEDPKTWLPLYREYLDSTPVRASDVIEST